MAYYRREMSLSVKEKRESNVFGFLNVVLKENDANN